MRAKRERERERERERDGKTINCKRKRANDLRHITKSVSHLLLATCIVLTAYLVAAASIECHHSKREGARADLDSTKSCMYAALCVCAQICRVSVVSNYEPNQSNTGSAAKNLRGGGGGGGLSTNRLQCVK